MKATTPTMTHCRTDDPPSSSVAASATLGFSSEVALPVEEVVPHAAADVGLPALPPRGVHGLQHRRVVDHDHRLLGVHDALRLLEQVHARGAVHLAVLVHGEPVVLSAGPARLVVVLDLVGGEARGGVAGVDVAHEVPEREVVVGRVRVALVVPDVVAQRALVHDRVVDVQADVLEPTGDELALYLALGRDVARPQTELDGRAVLVLADAVAVGVLVAGLVHERPGSSRGRSRCARGVRLVVRVRARRPAVLGEDAVAGRSRGRSRRGWRTSRGRSPTPSRRGTSRRAAPGCPASPDCRSS